MKLLERLATVLATSYVRHSYRGYGRLNHIISRVVGERTITRRVNEFDFLFDLFDPYWNLLLARNYIYEPEIKEFLQRQLKQKPIFVDCGANFGYWTLFALSQLSDTDCISIEASPKTFEHLKRNVEINNRHPTLINRAISSTHDQFISFETLGRNHAGASISGMKNFKNASATNIRTTDLRTVLGTMSTNRPILIKLDVEGAEIDAIKGLGKLVDYARITIIYEEIDKFCDVTNFLESRTGQKWHIFYISLYGALVEINHGGAQEMASRASGPSNFVATNFADFSSICASLRD